MSSHVSHGSATTTVIAVAPFVGDEVEQIRLAEDWSARLGVPAHITLLGPFLPAGEVTAGALDRVRDVFTSQHPIPVVLAELHLLGTAACLIPDSVSPFSSLSRKLQAISLGPTFGATHHLTVARDCTEATLERLRGHLRPLLPLRGVISEAVLLEHDGKRRVRELERFALAGARTRRPDQRRPRDIDAGSPAVSEPR
jgi:hypothetical protein